MNAGDGAPPAPAAGEGVWAPARRLLTTGLVLMVTLVAFESLSVATILPVVGRQLGDIRLYGWVFSAFLLASLLGIAAAGSVADRGHLAWPMAAGLCLFAAGLAIGGTAGSMPVLVAGRAVQGMGAGVVPAIAYVVIGRDYPPSCRPRMFAVLSTAWVVPGLVGPAVAAGVAHAVGWRWVFLGLLPLVAAALALAVVSLRRVARSGALQKATAGRPPVLAVGGVIAGAGVVLAALSSGSPWGAPTGVIAGGAALAWSLRRLTPPRTLRAAPGLPATILSRGLLTFTFFAGDAYVPYAIVTVRHAGTGLAAAALTLSTITWTTGAWVQDRRIARWGPRRLIRSGQVLILAGLALLVVTLWPAVPAATGVVAWTVAGAGMGLSYAPLSVAALDRAPAGAEGRTTAGLQLTDVLGQALGTGAAGAAIALATHGLPTRWAATAAFALAAAVGLVALTIGRRLPRRLTAAALGDGSLGDGPDEGAGAAGAGAGGALAAGMTVEDAQAGGCAS